MPLYSILQLVPISKPCIQPQPKHLSVSPFSFFLPPIVEFLTTTCNFPHRTGIRM